MFKWLRERRERAANERFFKSVPTILAQFAEFQVKYPSAYVDESWLPVKKPEIKRALKVGWLLAKDDKRREWIERGWVMLQFFQPGVGDIPLSANVLSDFFPENLAQVDRFKEFARKGQTEDKINIQDARAFISLSPQDKLSNRGFS